jgi:hypothetical protein
VKLTSAVQAALVLALHDGMDTLPASEENCTVLSGFDLRNGSLKETASQRNKFVGVALGLEMMVIPGEVFAKHRSPSERFWAVARDVAERWAAVAQRKDVAGANELRRAATGFIVQGVV